MLSADKVTVGLFPDLSSSVLYQEFLLEGKAFLTGKKHGMFPRPQEESDFQSHTDIVLVQLQTYVQALSAIQVFRNIQLSNYIYIFQKRDKEIGWTFSAQQPAEESSMNFQARRVTLPAITPLCLQKRVGTQTLSFKLKQSTNFCFFFLKTKVQQTKKLSNICVIVYMCLFRQLFSNARHGLDSGFPVLWCLWKAGLVVETVDIYSLPRVSHTGEPDHAGDL